MAGKICSEAGRLYAGVLWFEQRYILTEEQKRLTKIMKNYLGSALIAGKYTIDRLSDYKYKYEPTYDGDQRKIYNENADYISELKEEAQKIVNQSKNKDFDWSIDTNKDVFFDDPGESWKKGYDLCTLYKIGYKISMKLEGITTNEEQLNHVKKISNAMLGQYYTAGRICKKMKQYEDEHGAQGNKIGEEEWNNGVFKNGTHYQTEFSMIEWDKYMNDCYQSFNNW